MFDKVTGEYPNFKKGRAVKQILVDFDDAKYNGLVEVLGTDFAQKVIRGCSVHWMRSVNRIAKMVCASREKEAVFKYIGKIIQETQDKETVIQMFDVLSGKKNVKEATEHLSDAMAEKCVHDNITNTHWKKLKHWENWWTSTRHLQMFTKAFTIQEPENWDGLSKTTNPVESISRQTFKSHGRSATCCKDASTFTARKCRLHFDEQKKKQNCKRKKIGEARNQGKQAPQTSYAILEKEKKEEKKAGL